MGRYFSVRDERHRVETAMEKYQKEWGTVVLWFLFDKDTTETHDVYDSGHATGGSRWHEPPLRVAVLSAQPYEGSENVSDHGFYTTDRIHISAAAHQLRALGILDVDSNRSRLKDRIVYEGVVYTIEHLQPRGPIIDHDTVISIDGKEVDPDLLINDEQFQKYART